MECILWDTKCQALQLTLSIQPGNGLYSEKLASFADYFNEGGNGADDLIDVGRGVLAVTDERA